LKAVLHILETFGKIQEHIHRTSRAKFSQCN